jgi:hypothetical protein
MRSYSGKTVRITLQSGPGGAGNPNGNKGETPCPQAGHGQKSHANVVADASERVRVILSFINVELLELETSACIPSSEFKILTSFLDVPYGDMVEI